jgi:hypothetical protein
MRAGEMFVAGLATGALLVLPGCLTLSPTTPTPVQPPLVVSVTIEYIQPFICQEVASQCAGTVYFAANWMQPGASVALTADPTNHVWRGIAVDVPVNFPPKNDPFDAYDMHVFDPYLQAGPSQGITAQRLTVGRQILVDIASQGTPVEVGFLYIDANGIGHTPF